MWKPPRQYFVVFEDWRNFDSRQKFWQVLKLGAALILRYLLTDLLLIKTSTTRAYIWANSDVVFNHYFIIFIIFFIVRRPPSSKFINTISKFVIARAKTPRNMVRTFQLAIRGAGCQICDSLVGEVPKALLTQ